MIEPDPARALALRRMKVVATGLLVAVTVVFVITRVFEDDVDGLGYLRATAEAAMVGALADWFAVTALFRRPLGLPIPHTAIVPTRKDEIGRGLGEFVQENFLSGPAVVDKLRSADVARRLGGWLVVPGNAARVGDQVAVLVRSGVEVLRDDEVQEAIGQALLTRIRRTPAAPILGRTLEVAVADGRHQDLLTIALRRVGHTLDENRELLRRRLEDESPWWVPESIDDLVFARIFSGVRRLVDEVAADPEHDLRSHFDQRIAELAEELRSDPATQAKADALKDEALEHPVVQEWAASVWGEIKAALLDRSADPGSDFRRRLEDTIVRFGTALGDDPALRAKVDGWIEEAATAVLARSGPEVAGLIATTVERWDATEAGRRIELQVGRDLQFIRINGTVVGGLAGLVIHSVGRLL